MSHKIEPQSLYDHDGDIVSVKNKHGKVIMQIDILKSYSVSPYLQDFEHKNTIPMDSAFAILSPRGNVLATVDVANRTLYIHHYNVRYKGKNDVKVVDDRNKMKLRFTHSKHTNKVFRVEEIQDYVKTDKDRKLRASQLLEKYKPIRTSEKVKKNEEKDDVSALTEALKILKEAGLINKEETPSETPQEEVKEEEETQTEVKEMTDSYSEVAENVLIDVSTDGVLTIKVDLKKDLGKSSSGKTNIIASTRGNKALSEYNSKIQLSMNVFKYN